MNKTILFALVVLVASASFAFAETPETTASNAPGQTVDTGNPDSLMNMAQTMISERAQVQTREELQNSIQQRNQEMETIAQTMRGGQKEAYQNQNEVRLAVHALLSMENMTGGIGPEVSAIAKEYNNSIQASLQAEEKIQSRSSLRRFSLAATMMLQQILKQKWSETKTNYGN